MEAAIDPSGWRVLAALAELRQGPLGDCLTRLAQLACTLDGVRGAMVIATDDDFDPLAAGEANLSPVSPAPYLIRLAEIRQEIARDEAGRGGPLPAALFRCPGTAPFRVEYLELRDTAGYLVLAFDAAVAAPPQTRRFADVLVIPLRDARQWEQNERLVRLQEVVSSIEVTPDALEDVINRISRIFDADATTLFLRTRDRLRIATSTDRMLMQCAQEQRVEYSENDPQLTSHVFKTRRSLRLKDSLDPTNVAERTGLTRYRPRYPERGLDHEVLIQFLGVPMRRGAATVGVLRMSRRADKPSFTWQDEEALQLFGDLLGLVLAEHDQTLVMDNILRSKVESIIVMSPAEYGSATTIELANEGAATVFGRPQHELIGLPLDNLLVPGELERSFRGTDHAGSILVKGDIVRADGTRRTLQGSFSRIENPLVVPSSTRILAIARDVTDRERYLDLLASMGVVYFRGDSPGNTLTPSPIEAEITGYTEKELAKMNRAELFWDPPMRALLIAQARIAGGSLKKLVKWRHKTGKPIWIETDFRVYPDGSGTEIVEGVYREVTKRLELQNFLNAEGETMLDDARLLAVLKANAEVHYDYLTSLGHQLLSPLAAVKNTAAQIASGSLKGDDLRRRVTWVVGQVGVCVALVRNHSYMDKILRGEQFKMSAVDLGRIAIRVKNDFLHLIQHHRFNVPIDDDTLDALRNVRGHEELLRQVLVNLLDNAIKYSYDHTQISIRGTKVRGAPVLTITSVGLPVEPKAKPRLFERGVRGRRARQAIPHGTGFGLWLVKKILDLHGATIDFSDEVHDGHALNTFRIAFGG